nr:peptide chain release factor N(5)-glutamine methyltransferase [Frigoribacterium sp. PvP032]
MLSSSGVPTPDVDAELLLAHVLDLGRGVLRARAVTRSALADDAVAAFAAAIARRAAREPLQHITGTAAFRSMQLHVGPGVFVPRPETEGVAQLAIDALRAAPGERPVAVDLGTGSGAIALAMATEVPRSSVVAVELSPDAAVWTRRNVDAVGAGNVRLVEGGLADALPELDGTVSVVASNPPYIPVGMVPRDPEVRLHDPALALYGGADGLDVVRDLSMTALRLLRPGGVLVIEHGEEQGGAIRDLLDADGWRSTATHPDLTGRDRATTAVR